MSLVNLLNLLAKSFGKGRKAVSVHAARHPGKSFAKQVLRESPAATERRIMVEQRKQAVCSSNPVIFIDDLDCSTGVKGRHSSDSEDSASSHRHSSVHTCDHSSYVHSYSSDHCDSGSSYSSDSGSSDSGSYSSCD